MGKVGGAWGRMWASERVGLLASTAEWPRHNLDLVAPSWPGLMATIYDYNVRRGRAQLAQAKARVKMLEAKVEVAASAVAAQEAQKAAGAAALDWQLTTDVRQVTHFTHEVGDDEHADGQSHC